MHTQAADEFDDKRTIKDVCYAIKADISKGLAASLPTSAPSLDLEGKFKAGTYYWALKV